MEMNLNKLLSNISKCVIVSGYMVSLILFIVAYFNPEKQVTLNINHFGEAYFEIFLILITLPWTIKHLKKMLDGKLQ